MVRQGLLFIFLQNMNCGVTVYLLDNVTKCLVLFFSFKMKLSGRH